MSISQETLKKHNIKNVITPEDTQKFLRKHGFQRTNLEKISDCIKDVYKPFSEISTRIVQSFATIL